MKKDIFTEILERPIAFHPVFADVTGSIIAALFISQALYWQRRCPPGRDGWWWKTADEWFEETRLTTKEQLRARKILRNLRIVEETKKGIPCKLWFRVDYDELLRAIQCSILRQTGQKNNQACRDAAGKFAKKRCASSPELRHANTKTTQRVQSKIKTEPAAGSSSNQSQEEVENKIGVLFTDSVTALNDPSRIFKLISKFRLDARQVRILFTQFHDYCSDNKVEDKWALFVDFIRRAQTNSLHLTSKSEANLAPWV